MRKLFSTLVLFILCTAQLSANHWWIPEVSVEISAGYRKDSVGWNIAGPEHTPNVLSDLKWKSLQSNEIIATAKWITCDNIYLRGYADYGRIFHGRHTDSDFFGNDRTFPFSLTSADSNEGEVYDLSGGIGYIYSFVGDRITLAPIIGYSHHEQHLRMNHLFVDFNLFDPFIGPVPGLHSNYRARWSGPWVGMDFTFDMTCNLWAYGWAEYHWDVYFRGKGHWNLRTDFTHDFKQRAYGSGTNVTLGLGYSFSRFWSLNIVGIWQHFNTGRGRHREFFESGPFELRMNSAHWNSWSVVGSLNLFY